MNRNTLIWGLTATIVGAVTLYIAYSYFDLGRILFPTEEERLVDEMRDRSSGGGFVATFSNKEVRKWGIADGHRLERFSTGSTDAVVARLTSQTALVPAPPSWDTQGLSLIFPIEMAQRFNGKTVEIGLVVRSSQSNGAAQFAAIYATQQAGNSGWKSVRAQPEFQLQSFTYKVPLVNEGYRYSPIIVLHSDPTGSGRSIELLGAYVRLAPPPPGQSN